MDCMLTHSLHLLTLCGGTGGIIHMVGGDILIIGDGTVGIMARHGHGADGMEDGIMVGMDFTLITTIGTQAQVIGEILIGVMLIPHGVRTPRADRMRQEHGLHLRVAHL